MAEVHLSPSPTEEGCAQLGSDDYEERGPREIRALIDELERQFGPAPYGSQFDICGDERAAGLGHETDVVYELRFTFDDEDEWHRSYARRLEREFPLCWDATARIDLGPGNE